MASFEGLKIAFGLENVAVKEFPQQEPIVGTWQGEQIQRSFLGTPFFHPVTILAPNADIEGIFLFNAICTISRQKNIVKTAVQGRDATVKEVISASDFAITIQGILHDEGNKYPYALVKRFETLMAFAGSLKVASDLFAVFGIYEMVVESYDYPSKQGYEGQQLYSIKAVSDQPFELQITQR